MAQPLAEKLAQYLDALYPVGSPRGEAETPPEPIIAINTREDYEWAMAEIEELVDLDPAADSFFGRELLRLATLVREYELGSPSRGADEELKEVLGNLIGHSPAGPCG